MTAAAKPPTVLLLEPMYHRVTASDGALRRVGAGAMASDHRALVRAWRGQAPAHLVNPKVWDRVSRRVALDPVGGQRGVA